ncbi:probable aspartyl aminopeptidase [Carica papaya]|uniref:probable aspartyl aminopeptidase n=1 Tax=Carica papaya TaxID=3649 RepID=UPI000B8D13EA|nr:probable aspartyl aminopeptidase [Carica papaya]
MAAITRLQLMHSSSIIKPSAFLSKIPFSLNSKIHASRRRRFSKAPLLCSTSNPDPESCASTAKSIVGDLLDYLNESWTQFHATAEAKRQLLAAGFCLLNENEEWDLKPGGRYFYTRNMSCLVAFAVGENTVNQDGFKPNLETHLVPLLATNPDEVSEKSKEKNTVSSSKGAHHPLLMQVPPIRSSVGSDSFQGAGAPIMFQAMRRIISSLAREQVYENTFDRAIRQSFLVSADMAHGVHPNFAEKHEEHHRPEMRKGLVIKHNANQRYATSGVTSFLFKEVANIHNIPTQEFVVRNDMGCGSTIGPILASGVGIRTVDCGIAQLSMHSVREICGKEDIDTAYRHFKAFYQTFSSIDRKLMVD